MKILYHHRIASKDGQYVHLDEMVTALRKLGHEVLLVGPKIVETDDFGSSGGVVPYLKRHIPQAVYELLEFSYSLYDFLRLYREVRRFRPDVIYERCNLLFVSGIWVKRLTGLPLLLEVNSPLYEERKQFSGIALDGLAMWSERYAWRNADYTLPVTQVLAGIIRRDTGLDNQVVIPNGIDLDKFHAPADSQALRQSLGIGDRFVIGFTGFVREWHRMELVIDILAEYRQRELVLLLVGDGPARADLEAYAREQQVADRLVITGIVERERVNEYVALFDVALQPAVTPYASPLKMFEYLVMGKLIVAPDADNIREILDDDQNGLLFPKDDPEAFKRRVVDAIETGDRARICANAARTIEDRNFTWKANAERVTGLFESLLAG